MKDCKLYYILILVLIFFIYQSNNDIVEGLQMTNEISCLYIKEQDCPDNNCPTPTDGVKIMKINKQPRSGAAAPSNVSERLTETGEGRRTRDRNGCMPSAADTPPLPITYDECYQECLALDGNDPNDNEICTHFYFAPNRELGFNRDTHLNGQLEFGMKLNNEAEDVSDYYKDMSIHTSWGLHEHHTGVITDYDVETKVITVEWNLVRPGWLALDGPAFNALDDDNKVMYTISDNRGSGRCCLKTGDTELDEDNETHWTDSREDGTFNKLIRSDDLENPDYRSGSVINGLDHCNPPDCTEKNYQSSGGTCESLQEHHAWIRCRETTINRIPQITPKKTF